MVREGAVAIRCRQCGGAMEAMNMKRYDGSWSWWLLGGGLFCILAVGGILLGIPLFLAGLYRLTARRSVRYCPDCGYHFDVLEGLPEGG